MKSNKQMMMQDVNIYLIKESKMHVKDLSNLALKD